jgi:hypothetical protein
MTDDPTMPVAAPPKWQRVYPLPGETVPVPVVPVAVASVPAPVPALPAAPVSLSKHPCGRCGQHYDQLKVHHCRALLLAMLQNMP